MLQILMKANLKNHDGQRRKIVSNDYLYGIVENKVLFSITVQKEIEKLKGTLI